MNAKRGKIIAISVVAAVVILTALITACVVCLKPTVQNAVKITFMVDGEVYSVYEDALNRFAMPAVPEKDGEAFAGWFFDKEFLREFKGISNIGSDEKDVTLYAKFGCAHLSLSDVAFEEPTCIDGGCRYQICLKCNERITIEEMLPLGHTGGEADCLNRAVCTRCNNEYGEVDLNNHKNLIIYEEVTPTCEEDGSSEWKECTACGLTVVKKIVIKALGHAETVIKGKLPTCTEVGFSDEIYCARCESTLIISTEIAALGHEISQSYAYDDGSHWYACKRCETAMSDKYSHIMTGTDTCAECEFYIADEVFSGSSIQTVVRRIPISAAFENKSGLSGGALEIVVIDIAQGDSIFIKFPDGQTMLMDGGSVNFPIGNHYDRIQAVLNSYGVQQLDHLFVTHSDYDHVRYLEDVLDDYQVKNIYIPKVGDNSNGSTWKSLVKAIEAESYTSNGVNTKSSVRYNIGEFEIAGNAWRMRCYSYLSKDYPFVNGSNAVSPTAPDADEDEIINSLSPICFLEYAGRVILLTGDSNQFNEKYLVERGVFDGLEADVLKVAHHGSKTSTTDTFLSAFDCNYAIISYGTNVFGHPTSEVLSRLNAYGYKYIYKTKEDGNVRVNVYGNGTLNISVAKTNNKDITDEYNAALISQCNAFIPTAKRKEGYLTELAA